jgi:hypothetical protein
MLYTVAMDPTPNSQRQIQGVAFVIHSVAPTLSSVITYLLLSIVFIVGHLLAISLSGTAFPASFDEQLLQNYANIVIQPLATVLNTGGAANIVTLAFWGLAGWIICAIIAALATRFNDWRETQRDISIPAYGVVVRHPLRRTLFVRMLWQAFIAITIVLFTALILPVIRYCLQNDVRAIQATSFEQGFYLSAITAVVWMAIFHTYVVLFRLYLLRTRIFGEILY